MENQNPTKKRNPAIFIAPIVIGVILFVGIRSWIHSRNYESTDNASIEASNLPVLARVAGYIDSLAIKDYDEVKAGELLLVIDDREYKIALQQALADQQSAMADLENAKAGLTNAEKSLLLAKSNLEVQRARLDKSQADLKRDEALFTDASITRKQLDDTRSTQLINQRLYNSSADQVGTAQAQISTARAQIYRLRAYTRLHPARSAERLLIKDNMCSPVRHSSQF